jgi:diamine N-acetyltransferase
MIKLRELRISDVKRMYEFLSDPDVSNSYVFSKAPVSRERLVDFVRSSWYESGNVHFAISGDDDEYIGTVSLKNINYVDRTAEYAIMIGKEYWGTGYASEATKKIIDYGFGKLNLYKIYLNVPSSNIRANRFYEKFGFINECVFSRHVFIDGKHVDLNWYSIFNEGHHTFPTE